VKNLTESLASANAKRPASIKSTNSARVFFALWPQVTIQRQLHAVAKEYQAKCNARVMRADTLHMTLQFIGNIKRSQLPKLISAAENVSSSPPFKLELNTLSFWKHNRIGYATLATIEPALETLAATLQHALANAGYIADNAKFSPHVTLLRNVEHALQMQDFPAIEWRVDSFVLVESEITEKGAHYKILKEWPL
jgi:2'-5' RNA ligase